MAKAIQITEGNKSRIMMQYEIPDEELDQYIGLYLIAEFGAPTPEGYITAERLESDFYLPNGKPPLLNDFFEVFRL